MVADIIITTLTTDSSYLQSSHGYYNLREIESLSTATFLSSYQFLNDLLLVFSSNIIKNLYDSYLNSWDSFVFFKHTETQKFYLQEFW